jgi:transcriptional regulator with XRE-family HTH domain
MLLGLTQEKLGEALGLTFQQVQKYETGTNRIGASRLQQIAQFLKVDIAYFFQGLPGEKQSGSLMKPAPFSCISSTAARAYNSIAPSRRSRACA